MGAVFGSAAKSLLADASWAASPEVAALGAAGERLTGRVLDEWAAGHEGAVFHDLSIPGSSANVDHAVLGRSGLLLIDSKMWSPGLFWTVRGRTRRGLVRVPFADKQTLPMASDRLSALLRKRGSLVSVSGCLLVVHPSNSRVPLRLMLFSPAGARAVHGGHLRSVLRARAPRGVAEPRALAVLASLTK